MAKCSFCGYNKKLDSSLCVACGMLPKKEYEQETTLPVSPNNLMGKRFNAFRADMFLAFLIAVLLSPYYFERFPVELPGEEIYEQLYIGLEVTLMKVVLALTQDAHYPMFLSGVIWLYFTGFEVSPLMATPGKLLTGIRVANRQGKRINFIQANLRYFLRYLGLFSFLFSVLKVVGIKVTMEPLHDRIARTRIVTRRQLKEWKAQGPTFTPDMVNQLAEQSAASRKVDSQPANKKPPKAVHVDINNAAEEDIALLPGIGPILAKRIIDLREKHGGFASFREFAQLLELRPHIITGLRDLVEVHPMRTSQPTEPIPITSRTRPGDPVNLNEADREDLITLPGFTEGNVDLFIADREKRGGYTTWGQVRTVLMLPIHILEELKQKASLAASKPSPGVRPPASLPQKRRIIDI